MEIIFSVIDCIAAFSDSTSFFSPVSSVCTTGDSLKKGLRSSIMAFLLLMTAFISSWYLRNTHHSSSTSQIRQLLPCSVAASIPPPISEERNPNLFLRMTSQTHNSLSDPSSSERRQSDLPEGYRLLHAEHMASPSLFPHFVVPRLAKTRPSWEIVPDS